ncbi:hypothetical protein [uncultured Gammaproteobacteria bacterium]|jgi:metal-responsive CopG/Arc/MetJ family transcriptional regulator|nr:hypothetical protein [uncultured Gammaproteobacteria bacterium]CAC9549025.1 hypothetical protein [uncultured Gammaproteobacteria bacterium]CAC9552147.1 hypothetical protein [uncultured Gammaproteobacteria bacterium]CAC9556335.1 hypothetical protein [uncultured Gammaproteobacteria bacterium]CAC9559012.1 hypothetical protein [uncultured Gammaproteobacteria bacterium]
MCKNKKSVAHRVKIYFEQDLFQQIKQMSAQNNQSMSTYIRDVLRSEIERRKQRSLLMCLVFWAYGEIIILVKKNFA